MQTLGPDNQIADFSNRTGPARLAGNKVAGLFDFFHRVGRAGCQTNPGEQAEICLLYTSDAADDLLQV